MSARRDWTRPELLQVLRLYMRLPFGRLHSKNPDIVEVAHQVGRTPGAVARKATNFASVDDAVTSTGRKGSSNSSQADRAIWAEFLANPEAIAAECEEAASRPTSIDSHADERNSPERVPLIELPAETEVTRMIRARRVQSFFPRGGSDFVSSEMCGDWLGRCQTPDSQSHHPVER